MAPTFGEKEALGIVRLEVVDDGMLRGADVKGVTTRAATATGDTKGIALEDEYVGEEKRFCVGRCTGVFSSTLGTTAERGGVAKTP